MRSMLLVTLFTRANCSLCENAKAVIQNLAKKRSFRYHQVDVMASDQQKWRLLYDLDVPVLHVQRLLKEKGEVRKLMHRFDERQVEQVLDEAERHS